MIGNERSASILVGTCDALITRYRTTLTEVGEQHALSENEMLILSKIEQHPTACTQKKLQSADLHLSVSSICRIVESLRQKGLLTTEMDAADRRCRLIHLEKKGAEITSEFHRAWQAWLERAFGAISASRIASFLSVMVHLQNALG